MNVVPKKLVGAWARESYQLVGCNACETSKVIWLQTGSRYADIRISLPEFSDKPESFGGKILWQDHQLTFSHCIDLNNDPLDIAEVSWDGDVLVENATFEENGVVIQMKERWLRQTLPSPTAIAMELKNADKNLIGLAIKVADHAIVITEENDFKSAYFTLVDGRWVKQMSVGLSPEFVFPEQAVNNKYYQINQQSWQCVEAINL